MNEIDRRGLSALVQRADALAEQRLAVRPPSSAARERATQLRDHVRGHLRVRANSLEAPLLVLIVGPTGAGKSTLFNTLAGRVASPTGVIRPTTREAVILTTPAERPTLLDGTLAAVDATRLRIVEDDRLADGLAVVDAPDVDSIEHANRALTDRLVEAADLCIFVTTATRYADRVPWAVLRRVRDRGLPLVVVVNRMPQEPADQREILADLERLFAEAGLGEAMAAAGRQPERRQAKDVSPADAEQPFQFVSIAEGDVDEATESLRREAVRPIIERIDHLRRDRQARLQLAARALTGSLLGLPPLLEAIADDCDHETIDVEALRRTATDQFERELIALRDDLGRGSFLREEALRHWQRFVGADQITRFFSQGIGRLRGAIAALLRPAQAPVAEIRTATTEDLVAVVRLHVAEAARRTATAWIDQAHVARSLGEDPTLWGVSADFDKRLTARLDAWMDGIAADIQATGRPKRLLAQGASIGVNAIGTGVMLGTFIHTGGLTGAEVGVAAATAFLNQKLLAALFGEAAMAELIGNARRRLDAALASTIGEESGRFLRLVPEPARLKALSDGLRALAADVRALPSGLPHDLRAVVEHPMVETGHRSR